MGVTGPKGGNDMKQELKEMVEELQMAFNQTVCESDRIAEVLAEIKSSGYDVVLALDVTIGVTAAQEETSRAPFDAPQSHIAETSFNDEDRLFLRDMRIAA